MEAPRSTCPRTGILYLLIEFQKRGLPHMHLLLILAEDDKIRDPENIDIIASAELPDKTVDPKLHEIVKFIMIHGPCGVLRPNAPCLVDGVCTKGYPKQFRDTTAENIDGYPMYVLVTTQTIL
ncbi:ATP-dependent DNA helicase [Trichonephila clavipes]|uniref:ATP-dependent DNA helicase n=1 Tax=Trichonephila clavipes TaxID=2585209 RepID=A0A8X6S7I9_TRICX|nr:ATP-dependent DNA helicase [Trichonephila clavipes]